MYSDCCLIFKGRLLNNPLPLSPTILKGQNVSLYNDFNLLFETLLYERLFSTLYTFYVSSKLL